MRSALRIVIPTPVRRAARHASAWCANASSRLRYFAQRITMRQQSPQADLVLILPEAGRGWILEGIGHEIARRFPGKVAWASDFAQLPPARTYFFLHFAFIAQALSASPHIWGSRKVVFFTHPNYPDLGGPKYVQALRCADAVLVMCSTFRSDLEALGIRSTRLHVTIPGADSTLFQPHDRGTGRIGFCMAFYPRKAPQRVLEIVRSMPDCRFVLLGRRWREYDQFSQLASLSNFEYLESEYSDYPAFYRTLDVFVSPALIEGGPIPLLEAMRCNVVPVASRTGFAPDIIRDGENGYLFEVNAPTTNICMLIRRALQHQADVSRTVAQFTWDRFVADVRQYL